MTAEHKQCLLAFMGCLPPTEIDGIGGPISAAATEAAQLKLDLYPDGVWGPDTDKAIRDYIFSGEDLLQDDLVPTGDFWDHIRYWTREEFRCQCGGKYCDGFPAEPDQTLVELVDDLRHEGGAPGHRSSGLRCRQHNANQPGSAVNSKHLYGKALDFFIEGLSGQHLLSLAKADPRTNYAYIIGDGPYVHVDVK